MQTAKQWLEAQDDLISDGKCGCTMRLVWCLERQKSYVPRYTDSNIYGEGVRDEFLYCVGCKYFNNATMQNKPVNSRRRNLTKYGKQKCIQRSKKQAANAALLREARKNPGAFVWRESIRGVWKMKAGVK